MKVYFLKRFLPYFKMLARMRVIFGIGALCGIIAGAAGGAGFPFMVIKVFPVVFSETTPSWPILVGAVAMLPAVMLLRGISSFFSTYLMSCCGMRLLKDIRINLHEKLQHLPLSFFHRNTDGDIFSRVAADTIQLQISILDSAIDLIKQPIQLLAAVASLVYLSFLQKQILFLMLFVAIIPIMVIPLKIFGKRLLRRSTEVQEEMGNLAHIVTENLTAAREIRAYNLQNREMNRFEAVLDRFIKSTLKTVKYSNIVRPLTEVFSSLGIATAVVYLAVSDIKWEEISALFIALYMTYEPLKKLGEVYNKLKRGEAALDRIDYVLDQEDIVPDATSPVLFGEVSGHLILNNVWFKYLDEWVVEDISLDVPPGTVVALVGPSGAGKSTLADLVPRFYDVNKGSITIDGIDIRNVDKGELRSVISVVSQDTFLFNTTIEENIRMGRLNASQEEINEAAKQAYAHDFILDLEEGYQTVVGDRGIRLSGGQKQRIAIARAFLKASPILILDEATSALDSESEEMIQRSIEELVQGRTVIIIAHRFSTIRNADKIVVLEAGKMVGYGSHEELYQDSDVYKRLYDRQFSE
ncbi:MAG: ABC transporter ATP-binding protein [Pontiella sp.]